MLEFKTKHLKELRTIAAAIVTLVNDISHGTPHVSEEVKARNAALMNEDKCLFCQKPYGEDKIVRGVHSACYSQLDYRFRKKRLTEKDAIEKGWLLPPYDESEDEVLTIAESLAAGAVPIVGKPTPQQREVIIREGKEADKKLRDKAPKEKPGSLKPKGSKR